MGRRSIWSNEEVIELAKQFVSATDEVWRLQNNDDPECEHFRKIADVGHYRSHKSTRQGIYVSTASGKLLGSMNTHNVDAVIKMMKDCLKQYADMPRSERLLQSVSIVQPKHRWEQSYPEGGLDLTMVTRDLPKSGSPKAEKGRAWNQDRIWFSVEEVKNFLPNNLDAAKPGDQYMLDVELQNRLTRFSIIDTVRGQTSYYSDDEVGESQIWVTVNAVSEGQIELQFHGATKAESATSRGRDYPHGIATKLLGTATYNRASQKFESFQWLLLGTRWGRTVFNGRHKMLEPSPVGFVIQLTPEDAPLIAPSFLFAYRAKWVKH